MVPLQIDALLLEHDIAGFLPWAEEPAVFDPSVELPDDARLLPGEVGPPELHLWLRCQVFLSRGPPTRSVTCLLL